MAVLEGKEDPEAAREALIKAAEEAGLFIRGDRRCGMAVNLSTVQDAPPVASIAHL
ncbi:DUF982 domain-containing protein [Shinella kummerowiae]|uniref:DUF982 domain-containing protein n=1 Tax=Shinella kummerowiae TaxID=417745 RepID=A0A6N8S9R1_9HYPH|nr:DUF982 domain-containing protein [Shinella kummerowiae]